MPNASDLPALLGGRPVRPAGPPAWPIPTAATTRVLHALAADGSWGRYHGPHCERLIERLADMHGRTHVHLCASGTAAVELALRGVAVRAGDEVILAAYDFKANFVNVHMLGAIPVLVDIRPDDGQIAASGIEAAIGERTRAILVSHLHGGVVDMPTVRNIADRHGLALVEDACQMPGARIAGRVAGTWGDAGVLSFGGSKLLSAGRGGAVLTSRDDVAQRVKLFTHRGNDVSPLSEMQAAVVVPQLDTLAADHARRAAAVAHLRTGPLRESGLQFFPVDLFETQPGYYKVGMWYDPAPFGDLSRDQFSTAMRAEGIALDPGFRGLHCIHARRRFRSVGELTQASRADERLLTLHHPVLLGGESDWEQIPQAVARVRTHAAALQDYFAGRSAP